MAVTVKNATNAQFGIESAETGVEIGSFSVRYYPKFDEPFEDRVNEITGFAVPDKMSLDISLSGKVKGSTGLMAATHTTAITLANDTTTFQSTPGGIYMKEVTEGQTFNGWRGIDMRLASHPQCA